MFFAPITSATGEIELKGFRECGQAGLDGVWTDNAGKCPGLGRWIESMARRAGAWRSATCVSFSSSVSCSIEG
jgi:hypothetical protein